MFEINDPAIWEDGLHKDIDNVKNSDPNFKICIVSQSSKQAMSLHDDIMRRHSDLKINVLTGYDSGITKKACFEDINKTLEACNVFIFSPVIESGVAITLQMKKIYGVRSSQSDSQRAS